MLQSIQLHLTGLVVHDVNLLTYVNDKTFDPWNLLFKTVKASAGYVVQGTQLL
jgi:hypothetical protein